MDEGPARESYYLPPTKKTCSLRLAVSGHQHLEILETQYPALSYHLGSWEGQSGNSG